MYASGTVITVRSVRLSCRTCNDAIVSIAAMVFKACSQVAGVKSPTHFHFWVRLD